MFTPAEVAKNVIGIGKNKAALPAGRMLVLSIMAGIFIALAAVGSNTISLVRPKLRSICLHSRRNTRID